MDLSFNQSSDYSLDHSYWRDSWFEEAESWSTIVKDIEDDQTPRWIKLDNLAKKMADQSWGRSMAIRLGIRIGFWPNDTSDPIPPNNPNETAPSWIFLTPPTGKELNELTTRILMKSWGKELAIRLGFEIGFWPRISNCYCTLSDSSAR